jgi:hypothetical protein
MTSLNHGNLLQHAALVQLMDGQDASGKLPIIRLPPIPDPQLVRLDS